MRLAVFIDNTQVGWLSHEAVSNRFAFRYDEGWLGRADRFALSPHLPLVAPTGESEDAHSARVRAFFENLLPEGDALEDAARAHKVSKSSVAGLLVALGRETAGSLRILAEGAQDAELREPRELAHAELSERIRQRPHLPFSVWDGKVRLSIAGHQDKIAVYERDGRWFLVEGQALASTHILKPAPVRDALAGLVFNEFVCMQLASQAGVVTAPVALVRVPEPVLVVTRFDRRVHEKGVRRINVIDGCQALGLSVGMKYERPYGNGPDVQALRDGASLPRFFQLIDTFPNPAAERLGLLRWVIFQTIVGNTDAHAKNLSFFCGPEGLRLAPAYDIVCALAYADRGVEDASAMAVGDAFRREELCPYEWAHFAHLCKVPARLVAREMNALAQRVGSALPGVLAQARAVGAPEDSLEPIRAVVLEMCELHRGIAARLPDVSPDLF